MLSAHGAPQYDRQALDVPVRLFKVLCLHGSRCSTRQVSGMLQTHGVGAVQLYKRWCCRQRLFQQLQRTLCTDCS